MKTLLLLLIFSLQTTLCFAELHTPDTILSTKESLLQQDINIRRTTTAAHKTQKYQEYQSQDILSTPAIIPFQQAMFPVIYYLPPYWQLQAWKQQQAAMRFAAYYPPVPEFFTEPEPEPTPRPTTTPEPAAESEAQLQDAQLRITSKHTKTEAILPATLTQAQKDLINVLVAQQLVAEREQLQVENARITQQAHAAQRQHTQRMVIVSIGGVLVLAVVWVWSGQKCLIILRDLLHEGYKRML